jgi:hypothetical protein
LWFSSASRSRLRDKTKRVTAIEWVEAMYRVASTDVTERYSMCKKYMDAEKAEKPRPMIPERKASFKDKSLDGFGDGRCLDFTFSPAEQFL